VQSLERGRLSLVVVALGALTLAPARSASADEFPSIASDGLFVGARLEPGGAFLLGYDLDIYLTGDRRLSLGPAVTFSFLGEDGSEQGRRQDWLLTLDFVRIKVGFTDAGSRVRPYLSLGGGMTYASLPSQTSGPIEVELPDGTVTSAERRYDALDDFGGQISAGGGFDLYMVENLAFTIAVMGHLRVHEQDRLPLFWSEIMAGLRFGL